MRIDVLQEFVTVVKSRGFNRAAKNLHLSQSSLSTHISRKIWPLKVRAGG